MIDEHVCFLLILCLLVTIFLCHNLRLGMMIPPQALLLLWSVLVILVFLCFYMKLKIVLSNSVKNCVGISIGFALNFYIAFDRIAIFIVLILWILEHGRSFYFLLSSLVSFFSDLKTLSYESFTCLVIVTARYVILFQVTVKGITSWFLSYSICHLYLGKLLILWVIFDSYYFVESVHQVKEFTDGIFRVTDMKHFLVPVTAASLPQMPRQLCHHLWSGAFPPSAMQLLTNKTLHQSQSFLLPLLLLLFLSCQSPSWVSL